MPLSPYMFVLCIEWLGHSINLALSRGIWNPICISRSRPPLSHLLFGDDIVIFYKADAKHCKLLKEILHGFFELSVHKDNPRKTNIFFSKGVEEYVSSMLSNMLGFQKVHDLGHYLGVSLFHQRVTNSTMYFVVEKVRMKLQSWDARQLSIAGRTTLAQSVLLSILGYFMQSMMILQKICDEIERLARTFIWGTTDGRIKMSLVGWDFVCQPKDHSGLDQNMGWMVLYLTTSRGVEAHFFGSHSLKFGASCTKTSYGQSTWLPDEIIGHIKGIPPPHLLEGPDILSWCHTSTGAFTIKSAFKILHTTAERARHGLAEDPSCPICGHSLEDILHVIRDCTLAKEVWKQAKHFSLANRQIADVEIEMTRGEPLAGEWTYLNTDSAVRVDSGDTAAGGVQRDKNGEWILGYNKYLGNCS
ncbi:hypothetical protein Goshw_000773, partial [Gossypium schwendimanii]|nr:hypothetical protein [Gossypium schwendimanii]